MTMVSDEFWGIWKREAVSYFKVRFPNFPAGAEK
jgi:hypothetical protein